MAKGFSECLVLSFEQTVTDLQLSWLLEIPINDDNKIDLKHREGPKGNLYFKTKRFTADVKYHYADVVMSETQFSNYKLYQHTFFLITGI